MKIGSILPKMKSLGGKGLDLAGRGALYSQVFGSSSQSMTMGQRIGGAISSAILDNTLGQMGTIGGALRAGLESRGKPQSPTGGGGIPSTTIQAQKIKTDNVIQAINQSTQQILSGLNTLNATFRLGLNATTNQIQAQSSIVSSLKTDTQDIVLTLRDIYDLLNKQDYESKNRNVGSSMGTSPLRSDSAVPSAQGNSSILDGILGLAALGSLGRMALPLLTAGGGVGAIVLGLAALGGVGAWIMGSKPASEAQKAQEKAAANIPSNSNKDVTITNPRAAGAAGTKKEKDTVKLINKKAIFVMGEMEGTIITVLWLNSDGMYEVEFPDGRRTKVGARTFKFLDESSSLQKSQEVKVASNVTSTMSDAGGMSSADYLVNRQQALDAQRANTSEESLRAKEQQYEESIKSILDLVKYEAREVLFSADNIKFDASKIEFTQSGTGGGAGGYGGGGAGGYGGGGGSGGYGADATKVPLSEETRKAAEQLQAKGSLTTLPGQDPLAGYSDEQLKGLGVTRKEVRGAKGGREYSYTAPPKPKEGEGTFAKGASFEETSPLLMNRLMKDFNLTKEQAAGVIGNLAHESAGLVAGKQEINPVGGGRGGLGWAQWTGPRRREFEAYLERTGQSADDPEANYGFLKEELMGSEKDALNKLKNATTVEEATVAFEQGYERAGIKHYGPRTDYARRAADLYDPKATGGVPSLIAGLTNISPANAPAVAGVGPGNVAVKEAYGPGRPGRPEESIRNIASSAAEKAGMSAITYTSGVGDWISPERREAGQKRTEHSTGKALDVDGFASDEERARFIEEAVSMGANGVGVYKGGSIHIDQGKIRSWDLAKKKIFQDAIARGMEKRKILQAQAEQKKKDDAEKERQSKVQIKEESGLEKGAAKLGVTPESKRKMVEQNKANLAATTAPSVATPAQLDPTSVQASQKVAELSKKTTMNRESAVAQGPVTQNIISNNRQESDTTGTGYPPKDMPLPGFTATMDKHLDMLWT